MRLEKELDMELFEQLKIFDPVKFLKKLSSLNKEGQFLLEVLYGFANPVDKSAPRNARVDSRANYMLINSREEETFRAGMISFQTGVIKSNGKEDYFENMILVTEENIKVENSDPIPRITLKMRLILSQDSDKLMSKRYDRERYLWKMGWKKTPKIRPILPTSYFIKDEYLGGIEETFNGNLVSVK